jgi:hypothetical protein
VAAGGLKSFACVRRLQQNQVLAPLEDTTAELEDEAIVVDQRDGIRGKLFRPGCQACATMGWPRPAALCARETVIPSRLIL